MNVPHGFRAAVALGAAASSLVTGAPRSFAQPVAVEAGSLPGRRPVAVGVFAGVVDYSDQVEIGNAYYEDQVPGAGMLFGVRGGIGLLAWATSRLDLEGEARLAFASTGSGGDRRPDGAMVLGWRAHARIETMTDRPVRPFLLAGLGAETLVAGTDHMVVPDTDLALHAGLGARLPLGARSALRADLRLEMMAARGGGTAPALEAAVGYEVGFGGPGPRVGRITVAAARRRPAPPPAPEEAAPPPAPDPDRDQVAGAADGCPEEPEDVDGEKDEDGCPDPDDDGDGWADADDRCPRDPETVNGFADEDGCADQVPPELSARLGELAGVRFARGTVRLERRSRPVLDELTAILLRHKDVRIEIAAHTGATGRPERDRELSHKQAAYLKWYLVDKGIDDRRIDAVGHGSEQPKYDDATRAGRAANWRIELRLLSGRTPPPPGTSPAAPGGPPPVFLPAIPPPSWLAPYARLEPPLFAPRPVWLGP